MKGTAMSKDNGTPLCTNGQLATVASSIITALPKALEHSGLDIKSILSHTGEGERLSLAISAALKMLYNGHMAIVPMRPFPIWKTIKLGTGFKNADDFRMAIKIARMYIGGWGKDILSEPSFMASTTESEVDLIVVSNAELGFKSGAKLEDTYARALELGLELCPNEVGPQLRLQYTDQPNNEWLLVAIDSIVGSDGNHVLFCVRCYGDGKKYLHGDCGNPGDTWNALARFVFCCPRK